MIIVSLLICCLVGCATVNVSYVDKKFTSNAISQGNIGVGGVASIANRPLSPKEKIKYASTIYSAINKKYQDKTVSIMPVSDTKKALGIQRYHAMMKFYRNTGVIQTQYLEALHNHVKNMRYMAFARIAQTDVTRSKDTITSTKTSTHYNKKKKKYISHSNDVPTGVKFSTCLTVNIEMVVYDITNKTKVWAASFKDDDTNDNSLNFDEINYGANNYPPAPSVSKLATKMLYRLSNRLPK